ncbi:hypothetical protein QTP88_002046 [Uroleucon formosanum]
MIKSTPPCGPIFPTAKPLGSKIDKDHSYTPECSYCNIKIGLEDTRFHITHVKTSEVQKACLEIRFGFFKTLFDFRTLTEHLKFGTIFRTSNSLTHLYYLLLITQCHLCGNRSLQKFKLHKDIVHEYQLILDEDNIPATIKYGILICKPCHIYILLRRDKTTIIPSVLEKHCDATKIRIINYNKLKTKELESIKLAKSEINMEKKKEENQSLGVTSLPMNGSNVFTAHSSIPSKSVRKELAFDAITIPPLLVNSTSVAASMQSLKAVITTTTTLATEETPLTTIKKPILETPITEALTKETEDVKLTVETEKPTVLIFKGKRQHTFLDEHLAVPRTKKRIVNRPTITTDCLKHTMSEHKSTIPVHKPIIVGVKSTTHVNKPTIPIDEPTTQIDKFMTPVDKPTILAHKLLYNKSLVFSPILKPIFGKKWPVPKKQLIKNLKVLVDKPTIPPHKLFYNKSLVFSPVLKPIFSSKWPVPKKQLIKNLKVPVDKPSIADHKRLYNKSIVFSPILRPYFSSKCSITKKLKKNPESISPIKKPTKLQTNQSHYTLDSRSTSPRTEFSELSHQQAEPSILSSNTSDMNKVFKNLKVPIDKPVIVVEKPMIPVNKHTITDHTPLNNKSPVSPPVLSSLLNSKCIELKKNGDPLESVSPIIEPTQLQTNQLHQHTLESRSMSLQTEFPEINFHLGEPSTLSFATSDMKQLFKNLNVPVNRSTITDHKRLNNKPPVFSPVLSPLFSSKCTVLKTHEKPPETVSPVKKSTHLHQNTLDLQSTSPHTEFPKLRCQRAGLTTMSSATPKIIQLFENLKSPYPDGMAFINHLLNLETCPQKEYQTVSRTDNDDNDLTNCDYLSDKFVPSDDNSSDSHFIPVKKTSKSCNIPKRKFNLPKSCVNELNELSQYHDSGDSKTQAIDLQENSTITYYPDITIAATTSTITMSITTIEASTNIVSNTLPVFNTIIKQSLLVKFQLLPKWLLYLLIPQSYLLPSLTLPQPSRTLKFLSLSTQSPTTMTTITTESSISVKCADAFTIIKATTVTSDINTTTEIIFETTVTTSKVSYDSEFTSNKNTVATIPTIQ